MSIPDQRFLGLAFAIFIIMIILIIIFAVFLGAQKVS